METELSTTKAKTSSKSYERVIDFLIACSESNCSAAFEVTHQQFQLYSGKSVLSRASIFSTFASEEGSHSVALILGSQPKFQLSTDYILLPQQVNSWINSLHSSSQQTKNYDQDVIDARKWCVAFHLIQFSWLVHHSTCNDCCSKLPQSILSTINEAKESFIDQTPHNSNSSQAFDLSSPLNWHSILTKLQLIPSPEWCFIGDPPTATSNQVKEDDETQNLNPNQQQPQIIDQQMGEQQVLPAPPREWVQAVVNQALQQAQTAIFAELRSKQSELINSFTTSSTSSSPPSPTTTTTVAPQSPVLNPSGEVPWNWVPWLPKETLFRLKPCSYWYHTGHCSKGELCNFSHEYRSGMPIPKPPPDLRREIGMSPTGYIPIDYLYRTKPCKFFMARGYCLKGETCNFNHNITFVGQKPSASSSFQQQQQQQQQSFSDADDEILEDGELLEEEEQQENENFN